jgi:hypothetical protein
MERRQVLPEASNGWARLGHQDLRVRTHDCAPVKSFLESSVVLMASTWVSKQDPATWVLIRTVWCLKDAFQFIAKVEIPHSNLDFQPL